MANSLPPLFTLHSLFFIFFFFIFFFSFFISCAPADRKTADCLNDLSYACHYHSLDST